MLSNKDKGRIGLVTAIYYYSLKGYTISLPLNDTQWYDLIIEKDGKLETVQCKNTGTEDGVIDFRSTGGTKGKEYDNILNHPELDYLFCLDKDMNKFHIPVKDIRESNNKHSIRLRTKPNVNGQGFQTYKYLVD